MFRTFRLSIIRRLFTVHSTMVYVIQVCRQLSSKTWSCSKAIYKPVRHIPSLSVQRINSWWWTDELSETCRVSCQNKFVKLMHLVGFIIKKFVTMHGHMNVKLHMQYLQGTWHCCTGKVLQLNWYSFCCGLITLVLKMLVRTDEQTAVLLCVTLPAVEYGRQIAGVWGCRIKESVWNREKWRRVLVEMDIWAGVWVVDKTCLRDTSHWE